MISKEIKVYPLLCQGCAGCFLVCPQGTIDLIHNERGFTYPKINYDRCSRCKRCYNVCPVNLKENLSKCILGNILNSFVGYATIKEDRFLASSGGIVTAIVKWALEKEVVEAVICVQASAKSFWQAEFSVISHPSEIYRIRTSRYIPVSLESAFEDLELLKRYKTLGFIGLGCHIRALHNLKKILNLKNIHFTIGLICKQTKDKRYVDYILRILNVDIKEISEFFYRTDGYPGKSTITLKNGLKKEYPYSKLGFLWSNFYFSPLGCFFCTDPLAEYADIVVGDAWLKEFKDERMGISLVFSRTHKGDTIIKQAFFERFIEIKPFEKKKIAHAQCLRFLRFKKEYLQEKLLLTKLIQRDFPYKDFGFKKSANPFKILNVIRIFLSYKFLEKLLYLNIYHKFFRNLIKYFSIFLRV